MGQKELFGKTQVGRRISFPLLPNRLVWFFVFVFFLVFLLLIIHTLETHETGCTLPQSSSYIKLNSHSWDLLSPWKRVLSPKTSALNPDTWGPY